MKNKTSFSQTIKFNNNLTNSTVSYKITTAGWYRLYIQCGGNFISAGDVSIKINNIVVTATYITKIFEQCNIFVYLDTNKTVTYTSNLPSYVGCYAILIY